MTKKSGDRWAQILEASARIFSTKGYEATTIRDIAEDVGMLAGSLYYYIDTKEDLLSKSSRTSTSEAVGRSPRPKRSAPVCPHSNCSPPHYVDT